jgi:flagellar basal-body rod protein FlgB
MAITSVMGMAHLKTEWLSQRQVLLAQNIANANTPGFKSRDLVGFESAMQSFGNMNAQSTTASGAADEFKAYKVTSNDITESGNEVSLENEMLKLNETNSQYSFSTNIIKSFHRMISASLKG